jgi:serine-type D-Ala-D-Ala carboxypeptidase/endopeptidase (penicillin-binding protein 4)
MGRSFRRVFPSLLLVSAVFVAPRALLAGLDEDIHAILQDKLLNRASAGVEVLRLTPGHAETIFQSNAEHPLIPASNLKVVTTSAALNQLGPDFKFRTLLLQKGQDIAIVGDGDPTFGDVEMLRKVGWDTTTVFRNWAELLKKRGVTDVRNVIVDDSVFDQQFFPTNWPTDQENRRYAAEVSGFNLNANCVDFFIKRGPAGQVVDYVTNPPTRYLSVTNKCIAGDRNAIGLSRNNGTNKVTLYGEADANNVEPVSVSVHDPALFAATVFAETLGSDGIKVANTGRDRTIRASQNDGWTVIAVHETPLDSVLPRCNKDSMNLYAESLCKRLGFAATGTSGSWQSGTTAVATFLTKTVGVSENEFFLDDGCGLSKKNGVSANLISQVLRYNFEATYKDHFVKSLAVAGVDGTLDYRFKGTDLRGRVFAKSGYVVGVCSLSGYLRTKDDQWYAFSILFNGIPDGMNSGAKLLQEKIVRAIDNEAESKAMAGAR